MPLILAKDGFEPWLSSEDLAVDPGIAAGSGLYGRFGVRMTRPQTAL